MRRFGCITCWVQWAMSPLPIITPTQTNLWNKEVGRKNKEKRWDYTRF